MAHVMHTHEQEKKAPGDVVSYFSFAFPGRAGRASSSSARRFLFLAITNKHKKPSNDDIY